MKVAIVMGSDSDWPTMKAAAQELTALGIDYDAKVVSAHRMPADMIAFGAQAEEAGYSVIIAGAGGAAHLPGMLAAVTPLPVIGVPVPLKYLDGMDSLLSIVQMPGGGAKNAGLLAARILGAGEGEGARKIREAMKKYQQSLREVAIEKGKRLDAELEQIRGE